MNFPVSLNVILSEYVSTAFTFAVELKRLIYISHCTSWMERDGEDCISGDKSSHPHAPFNGEEKSLSSTLYLDQVGEVVLTCNSDGLSWKCAELLNKVSFFLLFFITFMIVFIQTVCLNQILIESIFNICSFFDFLFIFNNCGIILPWL